jgi:hypothetical protein
MHLDKSRRALAPGDLIVYGHALGRSAGLRYGVVLELLPDTEYFRRNDRESAGRFRVMGIDDHDYRANGPALLSRSSILTYGSRIVKIEPEQMPPQVFHLLKDFWMERQELDEG